ncbi:hypothetical protein DC522_03135 [Microvirga sp. KLBC 81]|uniref:DUF1906 domain-containing protein n=1 Tax=Microvirga sp. KLBC 81 TaxID=1862707 RepID=UPI000D51AA93|nr:DUF1906 domain-containing protein [Microvirga sp. KLBC 81]PVE25781.1 hypothetical protein DC522_03135 [Microvirga sp. KLBC 81]
MAYLWNSIVLTRVFGDTCGDRETRVELTSRIVWLEERHAVIIDTPEQTTAKLPCLSARDVKTVIRYYARDTSWPSKRLTRREAERLIEAGISIAVVHQGKGNKPSSFSKPLGRLDGAYARQYAVDVIGQPEGSVIYFAVDYDAGADDVGDLIVEYFIGVKEAFEFAAGMTNHRVGVYGNGLVCQTLLDLGLVAHTWLSQSTGHHGHREFKASGRWSLFQNMPSELCGLDVDIDDLNPRLSEFGSFDRLENPLSPVWTAFRRGAFHELGPESFDEVAIQSSVVKRGGVGLHEGPGLEFQVKQLLIAGTIVRMVRIYGDWALVDLVGDGLIDGAVHRAFLMPTA